MQQSAQPPDGWMHREYKTQLGPAARSLQGAAGAFKLPHTPSQQRLLSNPHLTISQGGTL